MSPDQRRRVRARRLVATGTTVLATVVVAFAWTAVVVMFSLGTDTGDDSEGNAGASVVAAILAILLVPITWSLATAWAGPDRRLRRAWQTIAGLGVCVAGLIVGTNLS